VLGHEVPIVAVTATITTLGIARDARPRRVFDLALGILVGITLAEVLVLFTGRGVWQLAIVVFVTLIIARAVSPNPAFAVAAAVQSALVVVLVDPTGSPFIRSLDGIVAGVVALLATALIPRDPRRAALRDARAYFSVMVEALGSVVDALRTGDEDAAELGLARLRRTQEILTDWTASLDSAIAIAVISPWLRRHVPELRVQAQVLQGSDLAARHLRLITRRIAALEHDGVPRPELADLIEQVQSALRMLGTGVEDQSKLVDLHEPLSELARRLTPQLVIPGAPVTEAVIVVLTRPLIMDVLTAAGMPVEEARALLPPI
jgi:uncharacterized membrane protein YgaE (UPF0421/DUF939 family)